MNESVMEIAISKVERAIEKVMTNSHLNIKDYRSYATYDHTVIVRDFELDGVYDSIKNLRAVFTREQGAEK